MEKSYSECIIEERENTIISEGKRRKKVKEALDEALKERNKAQDNLEFVRFKIKLARLSEIMRKSRSGFFNNDMQNCMGKLCGEFFENIEEEEEIISNYELDYLNDNTGERRFCTK